MKVNDLINFLLTLDPNLEVYSGDYHYSDLNGYSPVESLPFEVTELCGYQKAKDCDPKWVEANKKDRKKVLIID